MKIAVFWGLVVAGVFAGVTSLSAANPYADARATVRRMVDISGGKCSAVVIAPGVALTAKHCTDAMPAQVDGLDVKSHASHPTQDVSRLTVPGLKCPCAALGTVRPTPDEAIAALGYLYGDALITSRGEYLEQVLNTDDSQTYGLFMGNLGPGMSGGGVFRIFLTGEVKLVGILSAMGKQGFPGLYVELDTLKVKSW